MLNKLIKSPFNLPYEDSPLLARYLIEDNREDLIILDGHNSMDTIIIKSVFKKILGPFTLYNDEKTTELK